MNAPLISLMVAVGLLSGTSPALSTAWIASATDMVFPGNDESEAAHSVSFTSGQPGAFRGYNVRDAVDEGYFLYKMKVRPQSDMTLVVFYWGDDRDRNFDVIVNDTVIAEESLMAEVPGHFFERRYAVGQGIIGNASEADVKFLASAKSAAGGVFGLVMMPTEAAGNVPPIRFEEFYQQSPVVREAKKRDAELAAAGLDYVKIADRASEQAHQLQGEQTFTGRTRGRSWRDAREGGFFSYVLKVDPEKPIALVATYDGGDRNRDFYIYVDDTTLASQVLDSNLPGSFQDVVYNIPPELTRGKSTVTIKFEAPSPGFAGGVFDLGTIPAALASTLYPDAL